MRARVICALAFATIKVLKEVFNLLANNISYYLFTLLDWFEDRYFIRKKKHYNRLSSLQKYEKFSSSGRLGFFYFLDILGLLLKESLFKRIANRLNRCSLCMFINYHQVKRFSNSNRPYNFHFIFERFLA